MQGEAANRGQQACMLDVKLFQNQLDCVPNLFCRLTVCFVHACWETLQRPAAQFTKRNTGVETDLSVASPEDCSIVTMPQSQLCTLKRDVDWGVSSRLSCQNKLFAHCNCQRTADRLVACGSPLSCKRNNSQVDQRHQSPSFRCAVDTMNSLVLFAR